MAYGYDATGNRQSESRNGQTTAYHYLPTDQRLQSLSGSVNQSFAYDATGNTVDNAPFDFAYGGDLRLRHVTQGGHSVADYHYWHYATGQRTAKIVNGRVTHFDYAPWGPLLSESVGDVVSSSYPYADMTTLAYTDYVYLDDLPLAQIDPSGAVAYLHPNHLGAPLVATNENGEVVWQANYEPFGQASLVNPSVTLNLRLPGQYFDAETGLYQNWHRDYDPSLGRYLQSDPIGLAGGINTYAYVENNPLLYVDPQGLYGMAHDIGRLVDKLLQPPEATSDFLRNYRDMRDANTIGGDKYFHCKANCEATRRGKYGEATACTISDAREWFDQNVKGDPASASAADQIANTAGRSGGNSSPLSCDLVCSPFRPNGLPANY
ncbi:RHS repeat-associated core domain-containing protein [Methylocaldum gracile]|uniref:RHS repeat-associated core domain-containing protein n=1 Tax=Methylocaldum sp. 0917 TaxID=2485163 RepID=UPI001AEA0C1F